MNVGNRIKKIREFRNLTQQEMGLSLGYTPGSARVRVAQYESGRIPKDETITQMGKILNCNPVAIMDFSDMQPTDRTMQMLLWLDEFVGNGFHLFQMEKYNDGADQRIMYGRYNDYHPIGVQHPIGITIDDPLINDFMYEWAIRYQELQSNQITRDEYFEWKINYPRTSDGGGRYEPSIKWRKQTTAE